MQKNNKKKYVIYNTIYKMYLTWDCSYSSDIKNALYWENKKDIPENMLELKGDEIKEIKNEKI